MFQMLPRQLDLDPLEASSFTILVYMDRPIGYEILTNLQNF